MKLDKILIVLLIPLASIFVSAQAQATAYYKWTDHQGGIHYSDRPPTQSVKSIKQVQTQAWKNHTASTAPTTTTAVPSNPSISPSEKTVPAMDVATPIAEPPAAQRQNEHNMQPTAPDATPQPTQQKTDHPKVPAL